MARSKSVNRRSRSKVAKSPHKSRRRSASKRSRKSSRKSARKSRRRSKSKGSRRRRSRRRRHQKGAGVFSNLKDKFNRSVEKVKSKFRSRNRPLDSRDYYNRTMTGDPYLTYSPLGRRSKRRSRARR